MGMSRPLPRFSIITAIATFFLVIAGALVTSTGSGLAVPDWPLSFGQFFPPMEGGVLFEHGHRMVAGTVALMTFALTAWLWKSETRRSLCWLGTAASVAVLLQALLGGLTVLLKLPPQVSISHAILAQTFFCLVVSLALLMNRESHLDKSRLSLGLPKISIALTSLIYIQLGLGAALRHIGSSLALVSHMSVAGLVLLSSAVFFFKARAEKISEPAVYKGAAIIFSVLWAQILLGLGSVFPSFINLDLSWLARTVIVTAHVALGALLLAGSLVTTLLSLEAKP